MRGGQDCGDRGGGAVAAHTIRGQRGTDASPEHR